MKSNFSLWLYGLKASAVKIFGVLVGLGGFFIGGFSSRPSIIIISAIVGIILLFYGCYMRFNYQRNSGSIIHQGDGKW